MDKWQVSVVIPVIRPEGAERCAAHLYLDSSFNNYEVIAREDKERIGCPKMIKKLVSLAKYDWVIFLGDDTVPQLGLMLRALEKTMELPDNWGMVGLNDQYHDGNNLATHWMAHKKLLLLLDGEFFHTGYWHQFCDRELTLRCKELGRYVFAEKAILKHEHPIIDQSIKSDPDYNRVYGKECYRHDLILFRRRERNGWVTPSSS